MAINTEKGALLHRGGSASFIRWIHTRDGWFPEILHGRYQGRSSMGWVVVVDDEIHNLPEDTWAVFRD